VKNTHLAVKVIGMVLVAAVAVGVGVFIVPKLPVYKQYKASEVESRLTESFELAAEQINSLVPKMIDNDTRLDKATVGPGPRLTYHYTLPNRKSGEVDADLMQSILKSDIAAKVCSNEEMKNALQYGGIYSYSYSGNDNVSILTFDIVGQDCHPAEIAPE
jgi:hypothetical protein